MQLEALLTSVEDDSKRGDCSLHFRYVLFFYHSPIEATTNKIARLSPFQVIALSIAHHPSPAIQHVVRPSCCRFTNSKHLPLISPYHCHTWHCCAISYKVKPLSSFQRHSYEYDHDHTADRKFTQVSDFGIWQLENTFPRKPFTKRASFTFTRYQYARAAQRITSTDNFAHRSPLPSLNLS
jgi:hypothetical protein